MEQAGIATPLLCPQFPVQEQREQWGKYAILSPKLEPLVFTGGQGAVARDHWLLFLSAPSCQEKSRGGSGPSPWTVPGLGNHKGIELLFYCPLWGAYTCSFLQENVSWMGELPGVNLEDLSHGGGLFPSGGN